MTGSPSIVLSLPRFSLQLLPQKKQVLLTAHSMQGSDSRVEGALVIQVTLLDNRPQHRCILAHRADSIGVWWVSLCVRIRQSAWLQEVSIWLMPVDTEANPMVLVCRGWGRASCCVVLWLTGTWSGVSPRECHMKVLELRFVQQYHFFEMVPQDAQ